MRFSLDWQRRKVRPHDTTAQPRSALFTGPGQRARGPAGACGGSGRAGGWRRPEGPGRPGPGADGLAVPDLEPAAGLAQGGVAAGQPHADGGLALGGGAGLAAGADGLARRAAAAAALACRRAGGRLVRGGVLAGVRGAEADGGLACGGLSLHRAHLRGPGPAPAPVGGASGGPAGRGHRAGFCRHRAGFLGGAGGGPGAVRHAWISRIGLGAAGRCAGAAGRRGLGHE
jgi:hypothetical protein